MQRLRPVLILMLIVVDVAILIGTPFLERLGEVPRSLAYAFDNLATDPAGSALPLIRLMLGGFMLAFIIELVRGSPRQRPAAPVDEDDAEVEGRSQPAPDVPIVLRDRWHDLPEWTWADPGYAGNVEVGDTTWQVHRFTVTIESSIDFDEVLRRIEIHDAFRQLAEAPEDVARRKAVVTALTAGQHWPFLGRSTFGLATMRITAARGSVVAGLFVVHNQALRAGGEEQPRGDLSYLVVPTTAANTLVRDDPDRVMALVEEFGRDLHEPLAAAVARLAPGMGPVREETSAEALPAQEAVFRIQQTDERYSVSVARVDRARPSDQIAAGFPPGTPFEQVTPPSGLPLPITGGPTTGGPITGGPTAGPTTGRPVTGGPTAGSPITGPTAGGPITGGPTLPTAEPQAPAETVEPGGPDVGSGPGVGTGSETGSGPDVDPDADR